MTLEEILASIDERLQRAVAQIRRLEDARAALADDSSGAQTRGSRPRAGPRDAKPRRNRRRTVRPEELLELLTGADGMTTRQLAAHTGAAPHELLPVLKDQQARDQIRRSGARAATRWRLITDEERIAARAAELSRLGAASDSA